MCRFELISLLSLCHVAFAPMHRPWAVMTVWSAERRGVDVFVQAELAGPAGSS